jgi:hypothetical protein
MAFSPTFASHRREREIDAARKGMEAATKGREPAAPKPHGAPEHKKHTGQKHTATKPAHKAKSVEPQPVDPYSGSDTPTAKTVVPSPQPAPSPAITEQPQRPAPHYQQQPRQVLPPPPPYAAPASICPPGTHPGVREAVDPAGHLHRIRACFNNYAPTAPVIVRERAQIIIVQPHHHGWHHRW